MTVGAGLIGTFLGGWLGDCLLQRTPSAYLLVSGVGMLLAVPFAYVGLTAARPEVYLPAFFVAEVLVFLNTGPANAVLVNVALPEVRATAIAMSIFVYHLLGDVPSPILIGKVSDWTGSLRDGAAAHARWPWPSRASSTSPGTRHAGRGHGARARTIRRTGGGMRRVLLTLLEALFRVLFTYDCRGEENVPAPGPGRGRLEPSVLPRSRAALAPGAAAHPLHGLGRALPRSPARRLHPRRFGAFPVDTRRGKGRDAYERAKALVEAGEVVGFFPEGQRSRTGWMEPHLREGAARLALGDGGAARARHHRRRLPGLAALPAPCRARPASACAIHEPIDPAPYRGQPEEEALPGAPRPSCSGAWIASLLPGVKADLRMLRALRLARAPAPAPRDRRRRPGRDPSARAARTPRFPSCPSAAYLVYLVLDWRSLPQSRLAKWIRNVSPIAFLLATGPAVLRALGSPPVAAGAALVAVVAGSAYPYLYARRRTAMTFVRGAVVAFALEGAAQRLWPSPAGAHAALALYAAAFAIGARSVFWRYAAAVLLLYAILAPMLIGWSVGLALHLLAGLLAAAIALAFPYRVRAGGVSSPSSLAPAEPIE